MSQPTSQEIIAVHEELTALVRAGLPLASNLSLLAKQFPLSLRSRVEDLAARLAGGEGVDTALQATGLAANGAYATLFSAALHSSHPAQALERVIKGERRAADMRNHLFAEMLYPAAVALVGIGTLSFGMGKIAPIMVRFSIAFEAFSPRVQLLANMRQDVQLFNRIQTLGFLGFLGFAIYLAYAAGVSSIRPLWIIWPFGRLRANIANAAFCESLALLIENNIPLGKALSLAACSTTWQALRNAAEKLSRSVERGERVLGAQQPLPHYVVWLLGNVNGPTMAEELHREADRLEREAERQRKWFRTYLPVIVTSSIGIVLVLLVALINFLPLIDLINYMASPMIRE